MKFSEFHKFDLNYDSETLGWLRCVLLNYIPFCLQFRCALFQRFPPVRLVRPTGSIRSQNNINLINCFLFSFLFHTPFGSWVQYFNWHSCPTTSHHILLELLINVSMTLSLSVNSFGTAAGLRVGKPTTDDRQDSVLGQIVTSRLSRRYRL